MKPASSMADALSFACLSDPEACAIVSIPLFLRRAIAYPFISTKFICLPRCPSRLAEKKSAFLHEVQRFASSMSWTPSAMRIWRFAFFRSRNVRPPLLANTSSLIPAALEGSDDVFSHVIAARADAGSDERPIEAGRERPGRPWQPRPSG